MKEAQWIAPAGAEKMKPCHFRAWQDLKLDQVPERVEVRIAAESVYLLRINGLEVCRGPVRGTREINFYDVCDAAPFLRPGTNRIEVLVCCMNIPLESAACAAPALWMELGSLAATGREWHTRLCPDEWPENGPLYTCMSGFAEWHDLSFDPAVFQGTPDRTAVLPADSPVCRKRLLEHETPRPVETCHIPGNVPAAAFVPAADLKDRKIAHLSTTEPHSPLPEGTLAELSRLTLGGEQDVRLPLPPDVGGGVTMVFDFAREITGRVQVDLTAPAGTAVDFAYEEQLWQDGRLRADHTHTNPSYQFSDRCILREGRQTAGNLLMERGFRMIQLTLRNIRGPVTIHTVRAIDRRYPFAPRAAFHCGDYLLNRLWDTARETLSTCVTDVFTDCPWRERLFYCNDMFVENRTALKLFGDYRLHRHALRIIFSQARKDGLFPSIAPSPAADKPLPEDRTEFGIILSGNLTLPLVLLDYWMHTGDSETVREHYGKLAALMNRIRSWRNAEGVLVPPLKYWNFFDWSYELNGMTFSGKRTSLLNFLYLIARLAMKRLAPAAGVKDPDADSEIDLMLKQTVHAFLRPEDHRLADSLDDPAASPELLTALGVPPASACGPVPASTRLPHALAILAGAGEGPDGAFLDALRDEKLLVPELYYWIFLLDALTKLGHAPEALQCVRRWWGPMLDSGTPTLWENGVYNQGKAGFGGSASLCHGFSSAPAAFLQTSVLGIAPSAPGFSEFVFRPECPEVRFAHGMVPTPHGTIRVSWRIEGSSFEAELTVPEGCRAVTPAGIRGPGDHRLVWTA